MFHDYKGKCDRGEVTPGQPYLWENDKVQILNFPTKRHWNQNSILSDIENGLKYLSENYARMEISSLALPPLGCGLGGLDWAKIKALIEKYFGPIEDLDVYVYEKQDILSLPEDEEKTTDKKSVKSKGLAARPSLF